MTASNRSLRRTLVFACLFLLAAAAAPKPTPAQGAATPAIKAPARITSAVDDTVRVPLAGTVHPLTRKLADGGLVPDSTPLTRVQILLKRSDAQESSLRQLIEDLHNPASPSFHQWLTPDQFGQQFGPSDADVAAITTWLAGKGLTVTKLNPGRQTLEFQGTAAQFQSAFHTEIHKYAVGGGTHFANTKDPEIPAALAPVFGGFVSLNNFPLKSHLQTRGTATYNPATHAATPSWTTSSPYYPFVIAPADYDIQYDLSPLYTAGTNGAGQTIAIINESNIDVYLANQFRTTFGLPANPPQIIVDGEDPGIDGVNNPDGLNYASGEAYLDVEWAGAVAPQATVDLVIAADTAFSDGLFLAAERAVYSNLAPVMSLSFGGCEADQGSTNQSINTLWQQAAAQGITVVVSAGDGGSAGCDDFDSQAYAVGGQAVNGLGSTPYNVIVGGTDFYYSAYNQGTTALGAQLATYWNTTPSNTAVTASIKGVIPEQVWNNSQYGLDIISDYARSGTTNIVAGSGGASTCGLGAYNTSGQFVCAPYPKPTWQTGTGVPADGVRDVPDVSLFAANGDNYTFIPMCATSGDCQPVTSGTIQVTGTGGTSAAAPSFAGIMALVNQKYGRQGQADYTLYPLAKQYPAAFHDVTAGTNSVPCALNGIPAYRIPAENCIAVSNPITATDPTYGTALEGQIGKGTTPEYNAGAGYDLGTGLGTVDANVLVTNWNKVSFNATTTTLTPSSTSVAHGSNVSFTGAVKNSASTAATGSVALMTTSTLPNNQGQVAFSLNAGSFSGTLNYLPGGTYTVYGRYSGDAANASSSSTPVSLTVTPEASITPLAVEVESQSAGGAITANTSIPYGTSVILEAIPEPATAPASYTPATGTVAYTDRGSALQTVPISVEGEGAYSFIPAVGSHSIIGAYSGDASYSASTSTALPFTVVKNTPVSYGFSDTLTASGGAETVLTIFVESSAAITVNAAAPSGSLTLSGGPAGAPTSTTLSAGIDYAYGISAGIATIVLPATTPAGNYTLNLTYPGDTNYNAATGSVSFTITSPTAGLIASTTTATASTSSTTPAAAIQLSVTVAGQSGHAAPTGNFAILANGYYIYQGVLPASTGTSVTVPITLPADYILPGAYVTQVEYLGDKVYLPSTTTLNLTSSLSDFTLAATSNSLTSGSGTATDTLSLSSLQGFAGAVTLSCSSTAAITCSFSPSSVALTSGSSGTATLTVNTSAVTATGSYTLLITGTDATGQYIHTAGVTVNVTTVVVASSFSLTSAGAITVASQGASGNTGLTLTATGSFSGAVNLTCSVTSSPSGAVYPPGCSVTTPVTVPLAGTASSTLSITTTPQTKSAVVFTQTVWYAALGGTAVTALLTCLFLPLSRRGRRRFGAGLGVFLLAGMFLGSLAGCGGNGSSSGSSGGTLTGGTTLGAYTVTVTATDAATGKITASVAVTVTVN